jgi:hypothetical protein
MLPSASGASTTTSTTDAFATDAASIGDVDSTATQPPQQSSSNKDSSSNTNETLKFYSIIVASGCFLIGISFFLYYVLSNRAKKRKELEEGGGRLDIATTSSLVQGVFFVGGGGGGGAKEDKEHADHHLVKLKQDNVGKVCHQSCSFEKVPPASPSLSMASTLSVSSTNDASQHHHHHSVSFTNDASQHHHHHLVPSSPVLLSPAPSSSSHSTSSSASERYDTFDTHHHYQNQLYIPNTDKRASVASRNSMASSFGSLSLGRVIGQSRQQRPFSWQRRDSSALFTTPEFMEMGDEREYDL